VQVRTIVLAIIGESAILCLIAVILSINIGHIVLPWFNQLSDKTTANTFPLLIAVYFIFSFVVAL